MADPFDPSTDPDIPTPTQADLINLVHGEYRNGLLAGLLPASVAETVWADARCQWDEGHKRDAERRREEAKPDQKIGLPLAGGAIPPAVDSGFAGTFGDIKPPNDTTTGTQVPGQTGNERDHEIRQRERKQIESEVVETMHPSHREKYENPNTPEHWRRAIFQTYKDKLGESQRREDAQFQERLGKIVEAQDWLQRIKDDPAKAHLPRPANDSEKALLEWHNEISKPRGRPDYGNPPDVQPQQKENRESDPLVPLRRVVEKIERGAVPRAPRILTDDEIQGTQSLVPNKEKPLKSSRPGPETPQKQSAIDKLFKLAESNFFMGGGVAMAIAAYSFNLASRPHFGFWLLILSWLVMCVSIWRHRFFESGSNATEIIRNLIVCGLVGIVLFVIWILVV